MDRRLLLHNLLLEILGLANVYFQAPPSVGMSYPAILYTRDAADVEFADNSPYRHTKRYQVTIIDKNPDSEVPDRVAALPMSAFSRSYAKDGLNHFIYSLYF